jgi:hypothetical protein
MAENKTKQTEASVKAYLAAIDDDARRKDCEVLAKLLTKTTKFSAKMWGTSIVGFGSYHYKYASGREGDMCLVGFSSRKSEISIYGLNAAPNHEKLLSKLGKYKSGKGCLYIRHLSDIDQNILERLVAEAVASRIH